MSVTHASNISVQAVGVPLSSSTKMSASTSQQVKRNSVSTIANSTRPDSVWPKKAIRCLQSSRSALLRANRAKRMTWIIQWLGRRRHRRRRPWPGDNVASFCGIATVVATHAQVEINMLIFGIAGGQGAVTPHPPAVAAIAAVAIAAVAHRIQRSIRRGIRRTLRQMIQPNIQRYRLLFMVRGRSRDEYSVLNAG